ncbi:hypothetical protein ACR9E3_23850 [Actinomycetospora sp. C-140]
MVAGVLWVVLSAVTLGLGSLAQGVAAARHTGPLTTLLVQPLFLGGLVGEAVGFAAHVLALHSVSMAVAQGAVTGSLVVTALATRWWLGTRLGRGGVLAVGVVVGGLSVLGLLSGDTGTPTGTAALEVALAAAALVLALAGGVAALLGTAPRRGTALAVVSGLGFAVCSLAVRLVDTTSALDALTDPALVIAAAGGAVGGLAWAAALRERAVTTVTAIVVAAEVVPPSLLGAWLLGDTVSAAFPYVAPVVLLATAAAGIVLARTRDDATRASVSVSVSEGAATVAACSVSAGR